MLVKSADRRAWVAATVDQPWQWHLPLPDKLLAELRTIVDEGPAGQPITTLLLTKAQRSAWHEAVAPARQELESGRGFIIIDRLPLDQLSEREAIGVYWLLGQLLGEPFPQNVQGTLLYDVRDTGQDVATGARFSVTSYESSFHTDNSFGDAILDYVGLLCLKAAKSGGVSQNVSGFAVIAVLEDEFPDVLDILTRPLHVDRRGGLREGESATVRRPVIDRTGSELVLRYLRYWIEAGHEKVQQPLAVHERRALDVLDAILQRPELRVEFSLEPGQLYFINNRWILHNRTSFVDHAEFDRRRHLVRLWLSKRD